MCNHLKKLSFLRSVAHMPFRQQLCICGVGSRSGWRKRAALLSPAGQHQDGTGSRVVDGSTVGAHSYSTCLHHSWLVLECTPGSIHPRLFAASVETTLRGIPAAGGARWRQALVGERVLPIWANFGEAGRLTLGPACPHGSEITSEEGQFLPLVYPHL